MSRLTQPVGPGDHVKGAPDARVTIVEYFDYECSYCARAHCVVSEVMDRVGDEACLLVRHFPLSQIHPHALDAAQAAEAASAQGFFWAMHSLLFENQLALDFDSLVIYADVLGLDVPRFTNELRNATHLAKIQSDFKSGGALRRERHADVLLRRRAARSRVGRLHADGGDPRPPACRPGPAARALITSSAQPASASDRTG